MTIRSFITTFLVLIIVGAGAIYWWGKMPDTHRQEDKPNNIMEKISYHVNETKLHNGTSWINIVGNYWSGTNDQAIILLHMMPATKESWNEFAGKLNKEGYSVLAIDLRGHGGSTTEKVDDLKETRTLDYRQFTDEQHQGSIADVEGARQWLIKKGINPENIIVGGGSIGANLALEYLSLHPESPAAFLLSPGLDYRGIKTDILMPLVKGDQRVLLVAAQDDDYSLNTIDQLKVIGDAEKNVETYAKGGHATNLLVSHPELMDDLIKWLKGEDITQ